MTVSKQRANAKKTNTSLAVCRFRSRVVSQKAKSLAKSLTVVGSGRARRLNHRNKLLFQLVLVGRCRQWQASRVAWIRWKLYFVGECQHPDLHNAPHRKQSQRHKNRPTRCADRLGNPNTGLFLPVIIPVIKPDPSNLYQDQGWWPALAGVETCQWSTTHHLDPRVTTTTSYYTMSTCC